MRVRMSYGVADSELLTEDIALRPVQGAMSYKFRTGLHLNKDVTPTRKNEVLAANHKSPGVAYLLFGAGFPRASRFEADNILTILCRANSPEVTEDLCKCCWVLKPQATTTSNTCASGASNIALARSSLWRRINLNRPGIPRDSNS
jgi:hypothetical protein